MRSKSASLGQTVKLSCSLSSGTVTNYDMSWLQQRDGSRPRFLYRYYTSATPGSGDLSHFSASKENSQNTWYLTISNLQAEDEAVYYCAVWYYPNSVFHSDAALRGTETKILLCSQTRTVSAFLCK
uniref:Ig-like domain-containing protein n=1 Tax=Salvator merianae TaxID=96440 RepID=A0A8D0BZQ9_SALMN